MKVIFHLEKMNSHSLSTDIVDSGHHTSLAECLQSSWPKSGNLSKEETDRDGVVIQSEISGLRDQNIPSEMRTRIHILVSDQNGRTLFDSDRYIKSLFVHVFDEDGNLIYQSNEYDLIRDKQFNSSVDLTKQKTKKLVENKKFKYKCCRKDNNNIEKNSDCSSRERSRNKRSEVYQSLNVVVKRLKDFEKQIKVTNSDNDMEVLVNLPTDSRLEAQNENGAASLEANIGVKTSTNLAVDQKTIKACGLANNNSDKDSINVIESLVCDVCGIRYKSLMMLKRHKKVHEVEHTDSKNPLQCPLCKKVYLNWRSLTIHRRKHDAAKDNVCEKCGKCFRTKQELVRHEFVHSSAKSSPCHVCGKLFKNKAYAQMHSKLHSAENRKHVCQFCGKHFLRGPDIQKHMRIHTGEKPFICSQCGRSFSESSHLIRHERLHTGEKPYKCEKCDIRFTHKEVLIRHSFTHMDQLPFSCEVCNKGFKSKRELDSHWLVHDKPTDPSQTETCNICGKIFSHVLYLRYHMRIHNNLGRFECSVCGKIFKKPSYLKQHITNQHASSALPADMDLHLQGRKTNPDFIDLNVKRLVGPITSDKTGNCSQQYSDMNSEFCYLLQELENDQTKRNINSTEYL